MRREPDRAGSSGPRTRSMTQVWCLAIPACMLLAALWMPPGTSRLSDVRSGKDGASRHSRYRDVAGQVSVNRLRHTVASLSAVPSRIAGYPGSDRAADTILSMLREMGVENVRTEPFDVTVPVDLGARLTGRDGGHLPLFAFWPNGVCTSAVGPEGVQGHLVYGGDGRLERYQGKRMEDAFVVMEYASQARWVDAAMLGARAVFFLEPPAAYSEEGVRKFWDVPLDLPRFWVPVDQRDRLLRMAARGETATLHSRMMWRKKQTRNIVIRFPGTDPALCDGRPLVLSAYYDAMSVVPRIAPGADMCCGIAVWLEMARYFQANPPGRPVCLLATSAHYLALQGVTRFLRRHCLAGTGETRAGTESMDPALFLGLDLSSHSKNLGVGFWGNFYPLESAYDMNWWRKRKKVMSPYAEALIARGKAIAEAIGVHPDETLVNGVIPEKGRDWSGYMVRAGCFDSEVALAAGVPALSLVSVHDACLFADSPHDTADRVDFDGLFRQAEFLLCLADVLANDPHAIPDHPARPPRTLRTLSGRVVTANPQKSFVPDDALEGAVAVLNYRGRSMKGVRGGHYALTDSDGRFVMENLERRVQDGECILKAYYLDPSSGGICFAPDRGMNGDQTYPMRFRLAWDVVEHMVVLFPCVGINVYDMIDPRYLDVLRKVHVFDEADAEPFEYGYDFGLQGAAHEESEGVSGWNSSDSVAFGMLFAKPGARLKLSLGSGILGVRSLLLNARGSSSRRMAQGEGFPMNGRSAIHATTFQAAHDVFCLNRYRLDRLRDNGIANAKLDRLMEKSLKALHEAQQARERLDWAAFVSRSRLALGLLSRAYPDVKGTVRDVLYGLVFYMAMLLPFSFFLERLVVGAVDIRKQILGVFVIFMASFFMIRAVHPAFKIAQSPDMILLAFIILVLALLVMVIIVVKFEHQMRNVRQDNDQIHGTDVGRVRATGAAVMIGISNMRRRKLRTFLTAFTITILTFTVFSFTSVRNYTRYNTVPRKLSAPYTGVLLRDKMWLPLKEISLEYMRAEFRNRGVVSERQWDDDGGQAVIRQDRLGRERYAYTTGSIYLTPQESEITGVDRLLKWGRWFHADEHDAVILPDAMAEALGIRVDESDGATVRIKGLDFRVIGVMDSAAFSAYPDLDGEPMTPVDLESMSWEEQSRRQTSKNTPETVEGTSGMLSLPHQSAKYVPIFPNVANAVFRGKTISIAVGLPERIDPVPMVQSLLDRLAITLFVGREGKVDVYSSLSMMGFKGVGNLLVPIAMTALIVMNTMMGAVHERVKEIGIYSSVGLAPSHIGALFVAESCVFAILGAMGGYLSGQVLSSVFAHFGIFPDLSLNYSSTAAVGSTVLIMAVVVLSSLYPARMASALAVPDVTRRWDLGSPSGDHWRFAFPFNVSADEVDGIMVFLMRFFENHREESVGAFYARGVGLHRTGGPQGHALQLLMKVWLAPFDAGVHQEMIITAMPAVSSGIYQLHIAMTRKSGELPAWKRLNRGLLNQIRRQFLIWRTLDGRTKAQYCRRGKEIPERGTGPEDKPHTHF